MLIVPLIFSTIVVGIGKTGDVKAVGRMGVKALIYFEIATTAALALGLTIAHVVRPGRRPHAAALGRGDRRSRRRSSRRSCTSFPPTSWTRWRSRTSSRSSSSRRSSASPRRTCSSGSAPFLRIMDSVVAVMFQLTDYVMSLTPLGVFGAMAGSVSHHGLAVLGSYAKLVASLYGALVLFALLVLVPALADRAREHPRLLPEDPRAVPARVLDGLLRGGAAAGAREDGRVRRARVGGRLRHPGRLLLQPRRLDALHLARRR